MKLKIAQLFLFLALAIMMSCGVSPEEREERQANAFDLQGGWMTSDNLGIPAPGEDGEVTLYIINEDETRSNIKVEVVRDAWTAREENFFDDLNIPLYDLEKIRNKFDGSFSIGRGEHNQLAGGENYSDDFGESSKVYVSGHGSESLELSDRVSVNYLIEGRVNRDDFKFRGKMRISVTKFDEQVNSDGSIIYTFRHLGDLSLNFHAENEKVYYQQYFGTWSGKTTMNITASTDITRVNRLVMKKFDNEVFTIRPNKKEIRFNGDVYRLSEKFYDLIDLKVDRHPIVEFKYKNAAGDTIHFGGIVKSLGHLRGSIELVTDFDVETIGYFDFKRR